MSVRLFNAIGQITLEKKKTMDAPYSRVGVSPALPGVGSMDENHWSSFLCGDSWPTQLLMINSAVRLSRRTGAVRYPETISFQSLPRLAFSTSACSQKSPVEPKPRTEISTQPTTLLKIINQQILVCAILEKSSRSNLREIQEKKNWLFFSKGFWSHLSPCLDEIMFTPSYPGLLFQNWSIKSSRPIW